MDGRATVCRPGRVNSDTDDLDALLDLADNDVGRLSNVSVAAPALQTEVTSVSRQTSTVGKSPAAVYVITNEMIRRSGARSIPDVLRLVPGVQVARLTPTNGLSLSGGSAASSPTCCSFKGWRSVYSPLVGGVWWDAQDLVLEDVERMKSFEAQVLPCGVLMPSME